MSLKKSVSTRIRITKNGKIMRRTMGIGHFRTRKSTRNLRRKRNMVSSGLDIKAIMNY